MKKNRVNLNPQDIASTFNQLRSIYELDEADYPIIEQILASYPKAATAYYDELAALSRQPSFLEDAFTFDLELCELVLFANDAQTLIDGLFEMCMYLMGFETMLNTAEYQWQVEFTIGAWRVLRDKLKRKWGIDDLDDDEIIAIIGSDPSRSFDEFDDVSDSDPFQSLVSQLNLISFTEMLRLAGHIYIQVHFPPKTDPKVKAVYFDVRNEMQRIAQDMDIKDAKLFNSRLRRALQRLYSRYRPEELPVEWLDFEDDDDEDDEANYPDALSEVEMQEFEQAFIDYRVSKGPFGKFLEELFPDES